MSGAVLSYSYLALDWSPKSKRDSKFNVIAVVALCASMALAIVVSLIDVPKEQRVAKVVIPERIAKFIEKKKQQEKKIIPDKKPPPPPIKPRVIRKRPKKDLKLTKTQKIARKKAENSGLLAMANEFNDMIKTDALSRRLGKKTRSSSKSSKVAKVDTSALTSNSTADSGGVNESQYSSSVGTTQLSNSERVALANALKSGTIDSIDSKQSDRVGDNFRSEGEISLTMDSYKGQLYSVYARFLRKDPGLRGKIVFEITITPSGTVADVRIKMSELNNPVLEKKLLSRVKQFKFGQRSVEKVTITYPIVFLPS